MIDWSAWFRFGVGILRLSPDTFWTLTPYEIMCLVPRQEQPVTHDRLQALMSLYPDNKEESTHG